MLLQIDDTKPENAANILCNMCGVRAIDTVEGRPDTVVAIQGHNRQLPTEVTNQALTSVKSATEKRQLMPAQRNRRIQL